MPTSKIVAVRESQGLTQAELARKLGIYPQSLFKWEKGIGQPSAQNLLKLSKALRCPMERLI
ncbi:MAG: helix-turn-helix transcriptional regulator [Kiritimatiellales bacterium]